MTFRVGMKVCCIRDEWPVGKIGPLPQLGAVYEISNIVQLPYWSAPYLQFAGFNGGWVATYFRPVIERKTDISIFTRMLTPSTVDA